MRRTLGCQVPPLRHCSLDTGDLLTGFGFTQESALDLSDQVNQLAVDLASFTNFSGGAQGASEALTKALLGERESVKALGISILDADVKAKVLENTQAGLTFETERQAKAYATLQLAQEQSGNAIGDFARSQDSFANQSRIAQAAVEDLSVAIGEQLLPFATTAVSTFADVARAFADAAKETNAYKRVIKDLKDGGIDPANSSLDDLYAALDRIETEMALDTSGMSFDSFKEQKDAILAAIDAINKLNDANEMANGYSRMRGAVLEEEIKAEEEAEEKRTEMAANRMTRMMEFAQTQADLYKEELSRQEAREELNAKNEDRYATYLSNMAALDEELARRKLENEEEIAAAEEALVALKYQTYTDFFW